jgi:hypothetical protein
MWARHRIVVNDANWYDNDDHEDMTAIVTTTKIVATTVERGRQWRC